MSLDTIALALSKRLATYDVSVTKVAPGRSYSPGAKDTFITSTIIPLTSENSSFGGGVVTLERGVFRVSCYKPHGYGASTLIQMASAVRTHFFPANGKGLALTEDDVLVRIEEPPMLSTIMEPDDFHQAHISQDVNVHYYAHIFPS